MECEVSNRSGFILIIKLYSNKKVWKERIFFSFQTIFIVFECFVRAYISITLYFTLNSSLSKLLFRFFVGQLAHVGEIHFVFALADNLAVEGNGLVIVHDADEALTDTERHFFAVFV